MEFGLHSVQRGGRDGTFRELPAKHVDTQVWDLSAPARSSKNTKGFTDFSSKPSNYATDVFQPIFRTLEALSGKKYVDIYPTSNPLEATDVIATVDNLSKNKYPAELEEAIAFRVIADHIRTLCFSVADGILPGNTGRNYVLRRILRRAVKYGRALGFDGSKAFLPRLVDTLIAEFGSVFPEISTRADAIKETLALEENSFNKTLDRGMQLFDSVAAGVIVFPQ